MVAHKARKLLAKTAAINWLISAVMVAFHVIDRHDPDGTVIALWLVLATSGTIIASVRWCTDGGQPRMETVVDDLIAALVASRPDGDCAQTLRLVGPQETGSTIPVPRRSVL